ncbi:MAG: hypothetical protein ACREOO_26140 [bacterium]
MKIHFHIRQSLLALAMMAALGHTHIPPRRVATPTLDPNTSHRLLTLPLLFEKNEGQTYPQVRFLARASGGVTYFFTEGGVTMRLSKAPHGSAQSAPSHRLASLKSHTLKVSYIGANPHPVMTAEERAHAVSNYFADNGLGA